MREYDHARRISTFNLSSARYVPRVKAGNNKKILMGDTTWSLNFVE